MTLFYELLLQYGTDFLLNFLFRSIQNWTIERISVPFSQLKENNIDTNLNNEQKIITSENDNVQSLESLEPVIQLRLLDPENHRLLHCSFRLEKGTTVSSIKTVLFERLIQEQKRIDNEDSLSYKNNVPENENLSISSTTSNLAVIFMGKELQDDFNIGNCDLGNDSILDVLRISSNRNHKSIFKEPQSTLDDNLTESISNVDLNTSDESVKLVSTIQSQNYHSFFVYCEICSSLQNAKLRVCCADCGQGTIIFQNEPENWDDLLIPDRIFCHCYTPDCNGTRAKFYFKCIKKHRKSKDTIRKDQQQVIPLCRMRLNNINATCIACYSTDEPQVIVFPNCNHTVCRHCFVSYIHSSLWNRVFRFFPDIPNLDYTLDCPLHCDDSWIEPTHIRLVDERFYSFYIRFRIEEIAFYNRGVVCVHEKCNEIFYPSNENIEQCQIEECKNCSSIYCLKCAFLNAFSDNQCNFYDEIESHNLTVLRTSSSSPSKKGSGYLRTLIKKLFPVLSGDSALKPSWQESLSKATISQIAKRCPKCGTAIERNGGCMHMICLQRRCGFEWCWLCESKWTAECQKIHWFF